MMNKFDSISKKINKGGEISPFLFVSSNLELLHGEMLSYITGLLQEKNIDAQSLFHLPDTGEAIKIEEIKKFLSAGEIKPRFAFQVFLVENISRMTPQSQNACLKFFEEPGEGNIIILTNHSEAGILETILSRVQTFSSNSNTGASYSEFYLDMIRSYCESGSHELIKYMFSAKLEKEEYIEFLRSLLYFAGNNSEYTYLLDEIHEDINGIMKNNLQGKYICDKYIMKLQNAKG